MSLLNSPLNGDEFHSYKSPFSSGISQLAMLSYQGVYSRKYHHINMKYSNDIPSIFPFYPIIPKITLWRLLVDPSFLSGGVYLQQHRRRSRQGEQQFVGI